MAHGSDKLPPDGVLLLLVVVVVAINAGVVAACAIVANAFDGNVCACACLCACVRACAQELEMIVVGSPDLDFCALCDAAAYEDPDQFGKDNEVTCRS